MDIRQVVELIAREGRGHFSVSLSDDEWFVSLGVGREADDSPEYAANIYHVSNTLEESQRVVYSELGFPVE